MRKEVKLSHLFFLDISQQKGKYCLECRVPSVIVGTEGEGDVGEEKEEGEERGEEIYVA